MPESENTSPLTNPFQITGSNVGWKLKDVGKTYDDKVAFVTDQLWNNYGETIHLPPDATEEDLKIFLKDFHFTHPTKPELAAELTDIGQRIVVPMYYQALYEYLQWKQVDATSDEEKYQNHLQSIREESGKGAIASSGDPVNLFNGNFSYNTVDFQIAGGEMHFSFSRSYSQLSYYNGPLGFNWDHNYNLWLRVSDDNLYINRSNGALRMDRYKKHEAYDYWIPPEGFAGIIKEDADSFVLINPDGGKIKYQPHPTLHPKIHIVKSIEDRFGNYLSFRYSNGLLTSVKINKEERFVNFFYDSSDRIVRIMDFTGRKWNYAYDDLGDLSVFQTPPTNEYKSGLSTSYEYSTAFYSDPEIKHNLLSITDANGIIYLENEYGTEKGLLSYNRVLKQRQGSGEMLFDYANVIEDFDFYYSVAEKPSSQTIVTERDGRTLRYLYNKFGNLLFQEQYARLNGIPVLISSHFRYNKDGNLIGSISPLGVVTQYLYGREYYERKFPQDENYVAESDPNLSEQVRKSFNNIIAVVHRAGYYNMNVLNMSLGIWSADIFPDIYNTDADDVIQKYTYEPEFNQIKTSSDVRFTQSADPDAVENEDYIKSLTQYNYSSNGLFNNFYLNSVVLPTPNFPDGTEASSVVTKYDDYNSNGNALKVIAPNGLELINEYFNESDDLLDGFSKSVSVDPNGINIRTEILPDILGRAVKTFRPKYFENLDDRFFSICEYNNLDQIISETTTAPHLIRSEYSFTRTGNIKKAILELKDENNNVTGFYESQNKYDDEFHLTSQITGDISENVIKQTKIAYDYAGRPLITIAPSGLKNKVIYNERGIECKSIFSYGDVHSTTKKFFDADGRMTKYIDPVGNSSAIRYDAFGRQIEFEDALGNISITHYTKRGDVKTKLNFEKISDTQFKLLTRKEFHYDVLGQCITKGVNKFNSMPVINKTEILDSFIDSGPGELLTKEYYFNSSGKLIKGIDEIGRAYLYEYDILGRLVRDIDPNGNENTYQYDKENNIIRTDRKEITRDTISGEIVKTQYFASTTKYDELNRVIETIDSLGNKVQTTYDSRNNITNSIDSLNNTQINNYDVFNRLVRSTRFLHNYTDGETKIPVSSYFVYNKFDQITQQTDSLGRVTKYFYDTAGRLISCMLPDGTSDLNIYNLANKIVSYTDRNNLVQSFQYNGLLRHTATQIDESSVEEDVQTTLSFLVRQDALGRIIKAENDFIINEFVYDSLGQNIEEKIILKGSIDPDQSEFTIKRNYNQTGSLSNLIYPSGRTIEYSYDILERIKNIKQSLKGNKYPGSSEFNDVEEILRIEYEGLRKKRELRYNNSSTEYEYDMSSRLIGIQHLSGPNNILNIQYLHDALGNIRQQNEMSAHFAITKYFKFDSLSSLIEVHRLPSASLSDFSLFSPSISPLPADIPDSQSIINSTILIPSTAPSDIYSFDLAGNRTVKLIEGIAENYIINNLDQYQSVGEKNFSYNKNGSLKEDDTFKYQYDHSNQLSYFLEKTTNKETRYFYDSFGRRCVQIQDDITSVMIYNGFNLLEEYSNSVLVSSMVSDCGQDNHLVMSKENKEFDFYSDLTKSTRYLYHNNNAINFYQYDEFGNILNSMNSYNSNDILFSGKKLIKSIDKYDFVFRFYDSAVGRFIQRDPKGFIDGFNLYNFVNNNPVTFTDLLGTHKQRQELILGKEITPDLDSAPLNFKDDDLGMDSISKFHFTPDGTFLRWNENTQTWFEDLTGTSFMQGSAPKPKVPWYRKFGRGVANALMAPGNLIIDTGAKVIDLTTQANAVFYKATTGIELPYTTLSSTSKAVQAGVSQKTLIWDATGGLIVNPMLRVGDAIFLQDPEAFGEIITGVAMGAFFSKVGAPKAAVAEITETAVQTQLSVDIGSQLLENRNLALRSSQMLPGSASLGAKEFGNLIDNELKIRVEADIQAGRLPSTIRVTPRGRFGVDIYDTATGTGYDLTTATVRQVAEHDARYIFGGRRNRMRTMLDGTVITDVLPLVYDRNW